MTTTSKETLTPEQARAAGSSDGYTYIEAAPGSGKTTVAAERFGILRFSLTRDDRAVVAVSFTRSATAELGQRIRRRWGPSALAWPHRVATFDAVLCDLLTYLLRRGLLRWPGSHEELTVHDTWKVRLTHQWKRQQAYLAVDDEGNIFVTSGWAKSAENRVDMKEFQEAVSNGECTHDDIRRVLTTTLARPAIADAIGQRLRDTIRAIIVDEVFDANTLDLRLVEIACEQGVETSIIGDPWQALYRFRGARPEHVPNLVQTRGFVHRPLTTSFRFRTEEAQTLSTRLRTGQSVTLPQGTSLDADIVLAGTWKELWGSGDNVLPLSFSSTPENPTEAAAILLLDRVTQTTLGQHATFLGDALTTLGITDQESTVRMSQPFTEVLDILSSAEPNAADTAWTKLVSIVKSESPRTFPRKHATQVARLEKIRLVLHSRTRIFIPESQFTKPRGANGTLSPSDSPTVNAPRCTGDSTARTRSIASSTSR